MFKQLTKDTVLEFNCSLGMLNGMHLSYFQIGYILFSGIILSQISKKYDMRMWAGLDWPRIGSSGVLL
jgi:hypothetical protein